MHAVRPSHRAHVVPLLRSFFAMALLFGLVVTATPAAQAADASLLVSMKPNATPVKSGDDMVWTIDWSCSSSTTACTNAKIVVPMPVSSSGVARPVVPKSATKDSNAVYVADATINDTEAVWTFKDPLPGGATGQVSMILGSHNYITPDGTTYTPVATMTADNAATVRSDAPGKPSSTITVASTVGIDVVKERFPLKTEEPYPGDEVTYRIKVSNTVSLAPGPNGTSALQDVVITDTLPPTAIFQRAWQLDMEPNDTDGERPAVQCKVGGSTGPATVPGGEVVCPSWDDDLESAGVNHRGVVVYVTVKYPVDQPAANTPGTDGDDGVTDTARALAHPIGHPELDVTDEASVTHGFQPRSQGARGVNVAKSNNGVVTTSPGTRDAVWATQAYNTGAGAETIRFTDRMPCSYTSPTSAPTPCDPVNLSNTVTQIGVDFGFRNGPITLQATFADGTTQAHEWTFPGSAETRTWIPPKPITDLTWE